MKTYDRQEIKKGRIYYHVSSYPMNSLPSIRRVVCEKVSPRYCGWAALATFIPGYLQLEPFETRAEIFHGFEKAKSVCIKKTKARKKDVDQRLAKLEGLTKKEVLMLERERVKLETVFSGIKAMKRLPDLVVIVDTKFEDTAVKEANKLEIPIIGLVDTDTDPSQIDHVIPANDDSLRTVSLVIQNLADSVLMSLEQRRDKLEAEISEVEVGKK